MAALGRRRWGVPMVIAAVATGAVVLAVVAIGGLDTSIAARVNGEIITLGDLEEVYSSYGMRGLDKAQVLDAMISERLIYIEAKRQGYAISLEEAERRLAAELALRDYTIDDLKAELERRDRSYERHLEGLWREIVIKSYLNEALNVTEEGAMALYDEYLQENPELQLPPFEAIREAILLELEQRELTRLIEELRATASIRIFFKDD